MNKRRDYFESSFSNGNKRVLVPKQQLFKPQNKTRSKHTINLKAYTQTCICLYNLPAGCTKVFPRSSGCTRFAAHPLDWRRISKSADEIEWKCDFDLSSCLPQLAFEQISNVICLPFLLSVFCLSKLSIVYYCCCCCGQTTFVYQKLYYNIFYSCFTFLPIG